MSVNETNLTHNKKGKGSKHEFDTNLLVSINETKLLR